MIFELNKKTEFYGVDEMEINLNLEKETEKKFEKILSQYGDNERFAQSIINREILELKRGIVSMEIDLKDF